MESILKHMCAAVRRCYRACAAQSRGHVVHAEAESPHERQPYVSSDGRPKAIMEEAFRLDRQMGNVPWQLSWQKNERSLTFDDNLKVQLIKGFAAKELGLSDEVSYSNRLAAALRNCHSKGSATDSDGQLMAILRIHAA